MSMWRLVALCVLLAGCGGGEDAYLPPEQIWNDWHVRVEVRPEPLRQGMNEFLVIISDAHGVRPMKGMLVKIRTPVSDWIQAMPDGAVGVYRRALPVGDAAHAVLYVRIREEFGAGRVGELVFHFRPPAKGGSEE